MGCILIAIRLGVIGNAIDTEHEESSFDSD